MSTEEETFEALQLRVVIGKFGTKYYYNHENQLHRKFGPAIEWATGDKEWYIDDDLHRVDGPAVELANGDKQWFLNGKLHRTDGPAIVYYDSNNYWYINGKRLTEAEFLKHPLCTIK